MDTALVRPVMMRPQTRACQPCLAVVLRLGDTVCLVYISLSINSVIIITWVCPYVL